MNLFNLKRKKETNIKIKRDLYLLLHLKTTYVHKIFSYNCHLTDYFATRISIDIDKKIKFVILLL